jgi:ribosome maturation factor RimP
MLSAADDRSATLLLDDGTERSVAISDIDKARTVFEWGPKPKPGKPSPGKKKKAGSGENTRTQAPTTTSHPASTKEKQAS